jgi:S-ribosylhomocysteine lyase
MVPPILRICDRHATAAGQQIAVWHLRVSQPNVARIPPAALHSMEHFLIDGLRSLSDKVILAAPMGCATGYYIVAEIDRYSDMEQLLSDVLAGIRDATAVPHADPVHCGDAENHSLTAAQRMAQWLMSRRQDWPDPGRDAREL